MEAQIGGSKYTPKKEEREKGREEKKVGGREGGRNGDGHIIQVDYNKCN